MQNVYRTAFFCKFQTKNSTTYDQKLSKKDIQHWFENGIMSRRCENGKKVQEKLTSEEQKQHSNSEGNSISGFSFFTVFVSLNWFSMAICLLNSSTSYIGTTNKLKIYVWRLSDFTDFKKMKKFLSCLEDSQSCELLQPATFWFIFKAHANVQFIWLGVKICFVRFATVDLICNFEWKEFFWRYEFKLL